MVIVIVYVIVRHAAFRMIWFFSVSQRAPPNAFVLFYDAKVWAKKIPAQRISELGITLGKWERFWENRL